MTKFPLLPRKKSADKSAYGHVLIMAGSRRMTGAAILASNAALRSGAGLVTLGFPDGLDRYLSKLPPEVMRLPLAATKDLSIGPKALKPSLEFIRKRKISALAVGPGLSTHSDTASFMREIVSQAPVPIVLDADGLNAFQGHGRRLKRHAGQLVLTPHRREFERLFGEKWPEGEKPRAALAKRLSKFYDVVLVLKGHRTLVVCGDRVYVNRTGNPGLAKGGSGDVLTGIIAAFVGQGLDPYEAARWAVYFHGLAADIAVKRTGELGLTASDVIEALPKAFGR